MSTALIVVDIQNDYFPGGRFPLENSEQALTSALEHIAQAKQAGHVVIGIRHTAPGDGPFLADGSVGAEFHPAIAAALEGCTVIEKHQADSFLGTSARTDACRRECCSDPACRHDDAALHHPYRAVAGRRWL